MAAKAVRDSARSINRFSPSEQHAPPQASDLIALVVLALMLANIVVLMVLSS
jgi:hypothetical protein